MSDMDHSVPTRRRSVLAVAGVVVAVALAIIVPSGRIIAGAQETCITTVDEGFICIDDPTLPTLPDLTSTTSASTTSTSTTSASTTSTSTTSASTTSTTATNATSTTVINTTSTTRLGTTTTVAGATTTLGATTSTTPTSTTASTSPSATTTTIGAILRLSSSRVAPGERVTLAGDRLPANLALTINFLSAPVLLGTVTTNNVGSFQTVVTIPANATPGAHQINVTDAGGRVLATVEVTVVGASTPASGGLARTGASAVAMLLLAGTAIVMGWFVTTSHTTLGRRRPW